MLDKDLIEQIKIYLQRLEKNIAFRISNQPHEKKEELLTMLREICETSNKLSIITNEAEYRSGVSFEILVEDQSTGIIFSGVPGGHEFNSLILAIIQASTNSIKIDDSLKDIIKNIPIITDKLMDVPTKPLMNVCIYGGCLHFASCSFYGKYPFLCFTHRFDDMLENRFLNRFRQKVLRLKRFETNLRRRKFRETGSNMEYKTYSNDKLEKRNKNMELTKKLKSIGWRRIQTMLRMADH
jgi:hypothetical protein